MLRVFGCMVRYHPHTARAGSRKQAPRVWQQHLDARLIRIGFLQLPHDQGMYRLTRGTDYILLIVYIDDLLYTGSTDAITTWFEGELQKDLNLTVATTMTQYLGLNIQDGDNTIYLSAEKYTDTIAKRFGLTPTAISTPYRYTDGNRKASSLLKPAGIRDYQRKLCSLSWGSEGLGFESQCVHFGHLSAGGCQRSTSDPRLIIGKGYRLVVLGGYGRTDPLLNKPFYPNGLMVGVLT
ncbi:unnamed protein product [Closterium sp. NIES-54]